MVTNDMVRFDNVLQVAEREGKPPEFIEFLKELKPAVLKDKETRKRQPRPPAPEGGISIMAASRKYEIAKTTIRQWYLKGYVSIIPSESKYETFIDEARVAKLAETYKSDPGRGSWAVKRLITGEQSNS